MNDPIWICVADAQSSVWSQSDDDEPSAGGWLPAASAQASQQSSQSSSGLTPELPGSPQQQQQRRAAHEAERDALLRNMQVCGILPPLGPMPSRQQ